MFRTWIWAMHDICLVLHIEFLLFKTVHCYCYCYIYKYMYNIYYINSKRKVMSLDISPSNSNDLLLTQIHTNDLLSNIWNHVGWIFNKNTFHAVERRANISFHYKEWTPLIIRLWWKDDLATSMTELILISSKDFKSRYWYELVTPYFLINTASLPLRTNFHWYKWIRIDEVIRLGLDSDPNIASRLWLDKNPYISRHHMEIKLLASWYFVLRDLWSTNGTFISYPENSITQWEDFSQKNNIQRNMDEIQKDQFLSKLWPNLSQGMKQWPIWNCYFVAALNSIKEHAQCIHLLRNMIQPHAQGYRVQFLWINQFTIISDKDISNMWEKKLRWSLGDHILERAYWRLRHDRYDPSLRWWFQEQIVRTNWTLLATNYRWDLVHEWWWMNEVLSDFLGPILTEMQEVNDICLSSNIHTLSHLRWDELVTASSPSVEYLGKIIGSDIAKQRTIFSLYFPPDSSIYRQAEQYLTRNFWSRITHDMVHARIAEQIKYWRIHWDSPVFRVPDINNCKQEFHFCHAYSIWRIDHVTWYVELINPHDTIHERFCISIQNFYKYFYNLTIARLK